MADQVASPWWRDRSRRFLAAKQDALFRNRKIAELRTSAAPTFVEVPDWPLGIRTYLAAIAVGNLVWEMLHVPLYTIWTEGSWADIAFAVVHCTAGDVLIAMASLLLALVTVGDRNWPASRFGRVAATTIVIGVGYTIFSEWLNIVVRASWAYSDWMPVVPGIETGLSPLLQWIVVPVVGLRLARRHAVLGRSQSRQKHSAP